MRPSWNTSDNLASVHLPNESVPTTPAFAQAAPDELILIETYLHRRWELDPAVRVNTALQIAERIKSKIGLQPLPHQHVDDYLEEAAKKIRDSAKFR